MQIPYFIGRSRVGSQIARLKRSNRLDIFMLLKLITFVTVNKRRYINI